MDKIPKLGQLIVDEQARDAVHIAIAPVTAGEQLNPGDRIGFIGDAYTVGIEGKHIGIVDPYLTNKVAKGDKFYMFLFPNTITSLKHDWTHPDFQKEDDLFEMTPTIEKLTTSENKKWIEEFARTLGVTYDDLMDAAANYRAYGDYFVRGGDFEGAYISEEFWDNYDIITKETGDRGSFLSCSC